MGTCVSRTKNQRLAIKIDFNKTIVHWTRDSEDVSLTIVSSQEILAHIFSCFSQKVSSQLQPASEEKSVEQPTDPDLSPGGIQNLWSSPEHGTAWVQSMFSTQVIIDLLVFLNILFWVVIPTLPSAKELEASSFVESFDQSLSTLSSSWSSLLLKKARTGKLLFYLPNYEMRKNTLNVENHYNHLHVPEERAS